MIASWQKKGFSWSFNGLMQGQIKFTKFLNYVRVQIHLTGVPPGIHGIHIHEKGMNSNEQLLTENPCDCTCGHYNPTGVDHGLHVGDLCFNVESVGGVVNYEYNDYDLWDWFEDLNGRTIVLHEDADNLGILENNMDPESLKNGKAGRRIACAQIFSKK